MKTSDAGRSDYIRRILLLLLLLLVSTAWLTDWLTAAVVIDVDDDDVCSMYK